MRGRRFLVLLEEVEALGGQVRPVMAGNIIRWSAQSAIRLLTTLPSFSASQVQTSSLFSFFFFFFPPLVPASPAFDSDQNVCTTCFQPCGRRIKRKTRNPRVLGVIDHFEIGEETSFSSLFFLLFYMLFVGASDVGFCFCFWCFPPRGSVELFNVLFRPTYG